eukprot:3247981-Rhodomonas_salina.2
MEMNLRVDVTKLQVIKFTLVIFMSCLAQRRAPALSASALTPLPSLRRSEPRSNLPSLLQPLALQPLLTQIIRGETTAGHWVGCCYYWMARLMKFQDNTWVGQVRRHQPRWAVERACGS